MATTMEEIRQLQQQLFEAQQGKSVARLTDSNVVELVQLLLQRELVTLHLSGQGYITPKQLANEIKDQLLLSGGRISLAATAAYLAAFQPGMGCALKSLLRRKIGLKKT